MSDTPTDYRSTLNLPDTPFPMRGDLPKREPGWVNSWNQEGLYSAQRHPAQWRGARISAALAKYAQHYCCGRARGARAAQTWLEHHR